MKMIEIAGRLSGENGKLTESQHFPISRKKDSVVQKLYFYKKTNNNQQKMKNLQTTRNDVEKLSLRSKFSFSRFSHFSQFNLLRRRCQEHRLDGARNEWKKFSVFSVENLKISSRHF